VSLYSQLIHLYYRYFKNILNSDTTLYGLPNELKAIRKKQEDGVDNSGDEGDDDDDGSDEGGDSGGSASGNSDDEDNEESENGDDDE
jgi:hypothetical protein